MLNHFALLSLFVGAWLSRTTLALDCTFGEKLDRKECDQAISQIVYDQPGNTLDRVSTGFAKLSGNCTIIVRNNGNVPVTKQQIEAGFKSIFDLCQPTTGRTTILDDTFLETQNHQEQHDLNFFPPRTLTCGLNSQAPLTVDKDCQKAFQSIAVDGQGRLLGDKGKPAPTILKNYKTCTVLIYTTDASPLIVKKSDIGVVVSKAIKDCKGKSAVVAQKKGGSGNNGLTVVKVRSSKPCGSRSDSQGQFCAPEGSE